MLIWFSLINDDDRFVQIEVSEFSYMFLMLDLLLTYISRLQSRHQRAVNGSNA